MTWRVHHMTSWDLQVFETFEGFLQTHHVPGDAFPKLTDETAQARFTHARCVPTRDGEGGTICPSLRISAWSQAILRRSHPLFLVGDGLLNLTQLMPLSRTL